MDTSMTPPPGSDAAVVLGCRCAILDNNHGNGAYIVNGEPVFWVDSGCPVHGTDPNTEDCRLIKRRFNCS